MQFQEQIGEATTQWHHRRFLSNLKLKLNHHRKLHRIDSPSTLLGFTPMTVALTQDVEASVEEQICVGVSPNASTLVNDVLCSLKAKPNYRRLQGDTLLFDFTRRAGPDSPCQREMGRLQPLV